MSVGGIKLGLDCRCAFPLCQMLKKNRTFRWDTRFCFDSLSGVGWGLNMGVCTPARAGVGVHWGRWDRGSAAQHCLQTEALAACHRCLHL